MTRVGDNWRRSAFTLRKLGIAVKPEPAVGLPRLFEQTCKAGCGNKFRVPETSTARYCSRACAERVNASYP